MVETWRDSWFEEGTRLIYIVPSRAVDAFLPLHVDPAPSQLARVFVGRIELITSETKREVEVAIEQGVWATFMPKPFTEYPGSGMHTHLSLFEGDQNAFYEAGSEYQLSKTARSFIAGLLRHAPEITAVCNQWVNSYKRLWGGAERTAGAGGEAPAYVCWGHNNRSALVRVPMYKPQKGNSTRLEFRSVDAACNPYLAFSVILAAGLKGIEQDYELPAGAEDIRVSSTGILA